MHHNVLDEDKKDQLILLCADGGVRIEMYAFHDSMTDITMSEQTQWKADLARSAVTVNFDISRKVRSKVLKASSSCP